jgi:Lipase (class 3)
MLITDNDIAALCLGIYPEHFSPAAWNHFDDGSGPDGVCWGVKHVDDVSIVVLRGTVTLGDWLRNFQAWVEPIHHDDLGPVHAGFYSGMRTVQRELKEIVPSRPLIICGHSLGAARAVILSALLTIDNRAPIARICFGEPRAGFARLGEIRSRTRSGSSVSASSRPGCGSRATTR